jgi:hypothetical protein
MSKSGTASSAVGFVTVDDLRSGKVARINPRQFQRLYGRSIYSQDRDRWQGKGVPFSKDENGRVWYAAEDVLSYIDKPKHRSTCEYDTSSNLAALAVAREKLATSTVSAPKRNP